MTDSTSPTPTDQLLEQLVRQLKVTREVPSTALRLRAVAVEDCVDFIRADRRFDNAQVHVHNDAALRSTLQFVDQPGLMLEFGVYSGRSLTTIARTLPDRTAHGFDSFEGLPEVWSGTGKAAGAFDVGGQPPKVPVANVEFHVGWFDATVPDFALAHPGPVAFAHLDADLYSSTKTVFDTLGDRMGPGTVLLFDEYFGYHSWRNHEHRAFREFLDGRPDLDFEAVAIGHMNLGVVLRTAGASDG